MSSKRRPKILFLSYGFPRPGSGLGARISTFLRAFSKLGAVTFVFRTPSNLESDDISALKVLCPEYIPIPHTSFTWAGLIYRLLDSRKKYYKLIPLLLSKKPIYLHSNILVKNRSEVLLSYLKSVKWDEIDILHVNRLIMADAMIDFLDEAHEHHVYTVLDLDDIESEAVHRTLSSSFLRPRTFFGRYLRFLDLHRLRKYEKGIIPLFDACIVCSDLDRDKVLRYNLSNNPWVIPNSVDTDFFKPCPQNEGKNHDILFLGNMSFPPNIDAVHFFTRKIFPGILAQIPTSRFIIVGKNPVESVSTLEDGKNVIVIGEVPDTRKYYAHCAIVITPIRFGGGTRVKILEAMAMGKAIVTTSIGVEGIPASEGEEILIEDKEDLFATKCVKLLLDIQLRTQVGRNAREFVCRYFDRNSIEKQIKRYYTSF